MKNHSEPVSPLEISQAAYDGTSTVCSLEISQDAFLRHLFEEIGNNRTPLSPEEEAREG